MSKDTVEFLKLHEHPKYIQQCCDLLNTEWPRSHSSRSVTLRMSRDELPTCFCLVRCGQVLGHAKLSPLLSQPGCSTLHSVLIHPEQRKKGLGRLLMEKCEDYARSVGIHMVYLSTDDQEGFYAALGYEKCEPFSIYGTSLFPSHNTNPAGDWNGGTGKLVEREYSQATSPTMSQPPPPPPLPREQPQSCLARTRRKTFMKKFLGEESNIVSQRRH